MFAIERKTTACYLTLHILYICLYIHVSLVHQKMQKMCSCCVEVNLKCIMICFGLRVQVLLGQTACFFVLFFPSFPKYTPTVKGYDRQVFVSFIVCLFFLMCVWFLCSVFYMEQFESEMKTELNYCMNVSDKQIR